MSNINQTQKDQDNNVFYYWNIIKKWRKFIIYNVLIITILATIIAFVLPKWYYSYAVIKPAESSGTSFFSAILGEKGLSNIGKNLNVGGLQYSDLDYFESLLKSRKITISMIDKFDLKRTYKEKYTFKTIKQLLSNTQIQIEPKSNILIVGIYDKDPKRAKEMVEYYLTLLDSMYTSIKKVDLTANREQIEKRYEKNILDLNNSQNKLKKFQEKYGVVLPEEQFITTIKANAEIAAKKLLLETHLNAVKLNYSSETPEIKTIENQIKTLENKLNEMNSKTNISLNKQLFVSLGNAPELMNEYISIYRDVTIQSNLLELIYPLYQQAQMDEMNNIPPFIIIDKPFIPEYKEKPKRSIIIGSSLGISFILSLFLIFTIEYIKKLKQEYNQKS